MAKKVRFPLQMNGADVRTIEELREHFDLESVLGYFANGKLATWFRDRYYDNEASAIESLSADDAELSQKLKQIFGIISDTETEEIDIEAIQRRNEKLVLLRQVTDDADIISHVDEVAFNQEDLLDILDEGAKKIYLCQGEFDIPLSVRDVTYIGLNNPVVLLRAYDNVNFSSLNIKLVDICFGWDSSSCTGADRLCQAESLIVQCKCDLVIPILEQLVSEENFKAMMILAEIYWRVYPTKSNDEIGNRYAKKSKEAGEVIGRISEGENSVVMGKVLHKLADKGDKTAMAYYGFYCYLNGDKENVIKYLTMGAEKNDITALRLISSILLGAPGYERYADISEAVRYMEKSCMLGDVKSMKQLADMYEKGDNVSKNPSEAFRLYKSSAERGYAPSQNKVGMYYFNGNNIGQNYSTAFKWFEKAAEQGQVNAQYNLGYCYENGLGIGKDEAEAFKWYLAAAEQKFAAAEREVGHFYYNGKGGLAVNHTEAVKWYRKVAEQGRADAQCSLASCYYLGEGVAKDWSEANKWYKLSAEQGYATAQYSLGLSYELGEGCTKDMEMAKKYCRMAADNGDESAKEHCKQLGW